MDRIPTYAAGARSKAYFITLSFWILLAVIGILCYVNLFPDDPDFEELLAQQDQGTTKGERRTTQRIEELNLPFKTLYVFSKIRESVDSNFMPDTSFDNSGLVPDIPENEEQNSTVTLEALQECSRSVNEIFYCSKLLPTSDNIFFLETSWAPNQTTVTPNTTLPLSEKQACSIYSAARYNPSRKVILLFTCPVPEGYNWTKVWNILFDLPNFFFGRVDLSDLYANTSLSEFYHGPLALSKYAVSHHSDLFRQFILYMYGGTYMDLDVISFKPLDELGINYVITEKLGYVTAGVFNFEPGHHFLRQWLSYGISNYDPSRWSVIGPLLYTDIVKKLCNVTRNPNPNLLMNLTSYCNIKILPNTFFAVTLGKWKHFYKCNLRADVEIITSKSYGVHYWNHIGKLILHAGSQQPLIQFARKHCPPIYYNAGRILS